MSSYAAMSREVFDATNNAHRVIGTKLPTRLDESWHQRERFLNFSISVPSVSPW